MSANETTMTTLLRRRCLALLTVTTMAWAGLACVEDFDGEAGLGEDFRAEDGGAIEDPETVPGPEDNEGDETNAGVEGPLTIDEQGVGSLLSAGGVGSDLLEQAEVSYTGAAITAKPAIKIEALTGEEIVDAESIDGEILGSTKNYSFRVDQSRNQMHVRHSWRAFDDVVAGTEVDEATILQTASADLQALGVSLGAGQVLSVDKLMRASSTNPQQPEVVAYKVFVNLELDGHPVLGPKLVLSYYLDGQLHKLSARWPAVNSGPPSLPTAAAIQSQVFTALAAHPLGAETNPLSASAQLGVVSGQLRHVIMISGLLDNGEGSGRQGELDVILP
ncbi:hypothetical protein G6O69_33435 [Pseudenhygromyxa sp. WMMC2535]|uniref:hypothetical protein n=1 Tax=Pseudenhygromyxa sp. WMMC2535 TaxID=2712867 RepID=UPI0015566D6D|nr:hypothetical protein [Pseudenhygromyxa sp. WMMC2535]NVB42773.1 hypothetical protein [Pseudenhygromyxa sp. WMMC2535]